MGEGGGGGGSKEPPETPLDCVYIYDKNYMSSYNLVSYLRLVNVY